MGWLIGLASVLPWLSDGVPRPVGAERRLGMTHWLGRCFTPLGTGRQMACLRGEHVCILDTFTGRQVRRWPRSQVQPSLFGSSLTASLGLPAPLGRAVCPPGSSDHSQADQNHTRGELPPQIAASRAVKPSGDPAKLSQEIVAAFDGVADLANAGGLWAAFGARKRKPAAWARAWHGRLPYAPSAR
jgi:hypothetical protein